MYFKMGLSISRVGDLSLPVMKRVPSFPIEMQLNAFSGPALEATEVVVVVVCGSLWSIRSRFFSREEDDLLSGCRHTVPRHDESSTHVPQRGTCTGGTSRSDSSREQLPWGVVQLSQRAITSGLSEFVQRRRTQACRKALYHIPKQSAMYLLRLPMLPGHTTVWSSYRS